MLVYNSPLKDGLKKNHFNLEVHNIFLNSEQSGECFYLANYFFSLGTLLCRKHAPIFKICIF